MSPAEAQERIRQLITTDRHWQARFFGDDREAVSEWRSLHAAAAGRGGGGPAISPAPVAGREAAQAEIDKLKRDRAFFQRLKDGDPGALERWKSLNASAAGVRK
jgi:hypothetical protein